MKLKDIKESFRHGAIIAFRRSLYDLCAVLDSESVVRVTVETELASIFAEPPATSLDSDSSDSVNDK